jgi:hypothetical protein
MKYIYLVSFFLFTSLNGFPQSNFRKGYIVLNSNVANLNQGYTKTIYYNKVDEIFWF